MVGINVGDEGSVPTFGFGQILTAGFARHLGTILNHGQFAEESTSKDLVSKFISNELGEPSTAQLVLFAFVAIMLANNLFVACSQHELTNQWTKDIHNRY
jgi:hypothetical protein